MTSRPPSNELLKGSRPFSLSASTTKTIPRDGFMKFFFCCSEGEDGLLGQLVGALSAHIGDESASVRRLCVKGLVQVE